nr:hypothetical protein [uncultured Undibacterium sp.]
MDKFQKEESVDSVFPNRISAHDNRTHETNTADFAQAEKRKIAWAGLLGFVIGTPLVRGGFWGTMLFGLSTTVWVLMRIKKHHANLVPPQSSPTQESDFK